MNMITKERFERRVEKLESGCWKWLGSFGRDGFPRGAVAGKGSTRRVAYELYVGPVEGKKIVRGTCGNRWCVCPSHLGLFGRSEVSSEAFDRLVERGGGAKKLGKGEVLEIYSRRSESYDVLAAEYGVSRVTIWSVCTGRSWGRVTGGSSAGDLSAEEAVRES